MIALCVVMQVAMLVPHHHHSRNGLLCLDGQHCQAQDRGCTGQWEHSSCNPCDHSQPGACTQTHYDAAQPGKNLSTGKIVSIQWIVPANLHALATECNTCASIHTETLSNLRIRKAPALENFYISHITPTLPGRAPASMA